MCVQSCPPCTTALIPWTTTTAAPPPAEAVEAPGQLGGEGALLYCLVAVVAWSVMVHVARHVWFVWGRPAGSAASFPYDE